MKFKYRYITIDSNGGFRDYPLRPMTATRYCADYMAKFFFELYQLYGIIVAVRQGWALGAYREGGAIAHDRDADVFMRRPTDCTVRELFTIIRSHIASWNSRDTDIHLKLTYFPIIRMLYKSYLEIRIDALCKNHLYFSSDVNILYEKSIFLDVGYNLFCLKRHGMTPKELFFELKPCVFEDGRLFSFTDEVMVRYLRYLYRDDFMIPREGCGREINFRNRRLP